MPRASHRVLIDPSISVREVGKRLARQPHPTRPPFLTDRGTHLGTVLVAVRYAPRAEPGLFIWPRSRVQPAVSNVRDAAFRHSSERRYCVHVRVLDTAGCRRRRPNACFPEHDRSDAASPVLRPRSRHPRCARSDAPWAGSLHDLSRVGCAHASGRLREHSWRRFRDPLSRARRSVVSLPCYPRQRGRRERGLRHGSATPVPDSGRASVRCGPMGGCT